jgi:hypothetical protein
MNRRVSLDQLLQATTLQPPEAVAIVQQLIVTPNAERLTSPLGPPTTATVFIGADGAVWCSTTDSTFAVSELASLLDAMLPANGAMNVAIPGGLRYTIARARLEVDAPPFDSIAEFSHALARHERGERAVVIRRLIARANQQSPDGPLDRRNADPAVAQLRRQLRDADARVYDQQRAIDALSLMSAQPRSSRRGVAVAAGILIGVGFAGAGELTHNRSLPFVPSPGADRTPTVQAMPPPPEAAPAISAPRPSPAKAVEVPTPKRASRVTVRSRDREPARPRRFQWLRSRITFRADPL